MIFGGNRLTEMNPLYIIFVGLFIFLEIARVNSGFESLSLGHSFSSGDANCWRKPSVTHRLLSDVKIKLEISPDHHKHLHLKLVYRVLANEQLPVWIMRKKSFRESLHGKNNFRLEYLPSVMQQLGGFSFYQDTETTSAAVYFHQRGEFDGVIDIKYLIQGLSIDKIHESAKTKIRLGESGIKSREYSLEHPILNIFENTGPIPETPDDKIRRTYENRLYPGYPEILVFVSCGLARELLIEDKNHPDRYTPLISYILTLFNGVDMLYSKLKETNIKLNIAGIIIENECGAFSFLKNCYDHSHNEHTHHPDELLDAACVMAELESFLSNYQPVIPIDAYDVTVFLTRTGLYYEKDGLILEVDGLSNMKEVYNERRSYRLPGQIATVYEREYFGSYGIIAHELAHLMKVPHDVPLLVKDDECCENIMKIEGTYWCEKCLSWSPQSEQLLKRFFSSADCCVYTNNPRSLYSPVPRQMLTADEQCRCYGYRSAKPVPMPANAFCLVDMLCEDDNSEVHQSLIPLEGTPCGSNKVCWRYACNVIPY